MSWKSARGGGEGLNRFYRALYTVAGRISSENVDLKSRYIWSLKKNDFSLVSVVLCCLSSGQYKPDQWLKSLEFYHRKL